MSEVMHDLRARGSVKYHQGKPEPGFTDRQEQIGWQQARDRAEMRESFEYKLQNEQAQDSL